MDHNYAGRAEDALLALMTDQDLKSRLAAARDSLKQAQSSRETVPADIVEAYDAMEAASDASYPEQARTIADLIELIFRDSGPL